MDQSEIFYDELAPFYKYIFVDWDKSILNQSRILDGLIKENFSGKVKSILDASCGIGTQLIGLAGLGYRVTGSDISGEELRIAGRELKKRKLEAELHQSSMEALDRNFSVPYDLIIACDNSIPHLLTDNRILSVLRSMYQLCRSGVLITVRDFDEVDKSISHLVPYGYRHVKGTRMYLFQRWEFDGEINKVSFYFMKDEGSEKSSRLQGKVFKTNYYAICTQKLIELMTTAGFSKVQCIKNRFYQPVILGER